MFLWLVIFSFCCGLFCVVFYSFFYLVVLLGLEVMFVCLLFFVCFYSTVEVGGVLFFFLVVGVLMGGFGVSLLVASGGGVGGDYYVESLLF